LTAGVRYTGRQLFTRNNEYAIRHLDLNSDGRLKTWHIREYAGLEEGMNLFSVDIRKIRRDLESVPLVRSVTVQRRLPDTLAVRITERVALARLGARRSGLPLAVDREGYVLGPSARSPALPAITGLPLRGLRPGSYLDDPVIRDALKVLDVCDTTRLNDYIKIERVDVHDPDFLELQLETGPRVQLARNRFDWRLRKVAGILRANRQMGRMPSLINATGDNNFPVQYN
jgi:cell division septal protein FtsQ